MVYNYKLLAKVSPIFIVLGGITSYLKYESYQCQMRHVKTTEVTEPIVVFPNCKWNYYIPDFPEYDDQSSLQQQDGETCQIMKVVDNKFEEVSSYCKAVFALGTIFETSTFALLGSVATLGGFTTAEVQPSGAAAQIVTDWVANPAAASA